MIDALVGGSLFGKPVERTTKAGRPFATAKVRAGTADGSMFVGVVAFKADVVAALLALDSGDSVALAGELKIGTYTDRQGQAQPSAELVAQAITTAYHVTRKRAAQRGQAVEADEPAAAPVAPSTQRGLSHDDIPF